MAAHKRNPGKSPGGHTEDWQRRTTPLKLRLPPLVRQVIRERADALGVEQNAYVGWLVMADVARSKGGFEIPPPPRKD